MAKKKSAKTRRPATGDGLTPLQRKGLEALNDAEYGRMETRRKRKKSLARRAYRRIPSKHKILRPTVFVALGAAEVTVKAAKAASIGAGRAGRWGGRKIVAKVKTDIRYRKWTPEPASREKGHWFQPVSDITCCGTHFSNAQTLNAHMVSKHRGEPRQKMSSRPQIQRGHTRRTAGRVIVRPAAAGGGRHRARHRIPDAKRVGDLVAAYSAPISNLRKQVNSVEANAIKSTLNNAGAKIGETTKPRTLQDLREQLIALEMGFGGMADGIRDYGAMLRRDSEKGANIDPAVVNPYFTKATDGLVEAGRAFTQLIAAFEDAYGLHISAKKTGLTEPNINLKVG